MKELSRWPLLLAAVLLVGAAIGLDLERAPALVAGLGALGAAAFGAFLYAEGARHREWWDRKISGETPRRPTPGQEDFRSEGVRHAEE